MNLNCDIVMDLAGLYSEGTASDRTMTEIMEHLKECPECRKFYRQYAAIQSRKNISNKPDEEKINDGEAEYAVLAEKIRNRRLLMAMGIVVYSCFAAGMVTAFIIKSHRDKH